jgi:hypothetical protein
MLPYERWEHQDILSLSLCYPIQQRDEAISLLHERRTLRQRLHALLTDYEKLKRDVSCVWPPPSHSNNGRSSNAPGGFTSLKTQTNAASRHQPPEPLRFAPSSFLISASTPPPARRVPLVPLPRTVQAPEPVSLTTSPATRTASYRAPSPSPFTLADLTTTPRATGLGLLVGPATSLAVRHPFRHPLPDPRAAAQVLTHEPRSAQPNSQDSRSVERTAKPAAVDDQHISAARQWILRSRSRAERRLLDRQRISHRELI